MKYKTLILFFVLNLSLCCFSSELIKQPDEYSCAPACSYNLIKKLCPNCDNNIQYLIKLEKTNKKGTTAYNLCNGINKYFRTQNKNVNIEYYGVKKVRKYKISSDINFEKLKNNLNQNTQVIINIGVYTKNKDGSYTRQYGHYVNLDSIDNNSITVFEDNIVFTYGSLSFDFIISVILIFVLGFNFNGILFMVFANMISYAKGNKGKYILISIALISYLFTNFKSFQYVRFNFNLCNTIFIGFDGFDYNAV